MSTTFNSGDFKDKSFWKRPEGVTGSIFMVALLLGGGVLLYKALPYLITLASNALYLAGMLLVLGAIIYMVLDPKMRNLVWYMYKSVMRSLTGMFVQIDPIGVLKSYIEDLEDNLRKMSQQIGNLRGQMRKMKTIMETNNKDIEFNMRLAAKAGEKGDDKNKVLAARKAARLQESNEKYDVLYKKMEILNRILVKMYENSEILLEDTKDQVAVKTQERAAIRASHSAMKSAMNIISGNPDKRLMFDQAMEAIADDVASKVGEMERFMEMSTSFMDSVDLQNAVFQDDGLKMLEDWEKNSTLMLLGDKTKSDNKSLDLNQQFPEKEPLKKDDTQSNQYDNLFG